MEVKYQRIAEDIRKKINIGEYKEDEAIPSELQLQKQYEVSRHTIRQAVALLVNEGYLRKEKGSGTYVDYSLIHENLNVGTNKVIGVITTYVSDYIFPSIIRGIEKTLSKAGYSLILASTNNSYTTEKKCLEKMMKQNVQGLIVEPTKSNQYNPNLALYSQLREQGLPIVMINASYEELNIPKIAVDDEISGFIATDYLIQNNHKKILLVTKIDDLQGKYRMKGFIKACESGKIVFKSQNILTYTTENKDLILDNVIEKILSKEVTGIVCYNDEIASGIDELMIKNGLSIPEDVSIVGNDNSTLSKYGSVKYTTIDHPKEKMGIAAADWILSSIQIRDELESVVYMPEIVEGESVKELDDWIRNK